MDDETRRKKSWPPDWQYLYETRVLRPLRDVATGACSKVSDVALDYDGRCITVRAREVLNDQERDLVRTSLQLAAKKLDSGGRDYRVHFQHTLHYAYTWHGLELGAFDYEPFTARNTEFKLSIEELLSLGVAYRQLAKECANFDHVATFARGGVPALNFITQQEFEKRSAVNPDDFPADLLEKYHLFPDLKSPHTRSLVANWLGRLQKPCSILVFDTGSEGNGARAALDVIKECLVSSASSFVRRVRILGIVDGYSKDQITDNQSICTRSGDSITAEIDYIRVSCILTEDCPALLGYDTLEFKAKVKPVTKRAILRLPEVSSSRNLEVGALSASAVLSELIRNPARLSLNLSETATPSHLE